MPVYDYRCKTHGVFYELAQLSEFQDPKPCPQCGELCGRIIQISPQLLDMDSQKRHAHEVNEKAQHEPVVSTAERRSEDHVHSKGCGCQNQKVKKSALMLTANGEKMFPSMRPWMISH